MAKPLSDILTPKESKTRFLRALRKHSNVARSCRAAKITRDTAYRWRDEDAEFHRNWQEALEAGVEELEQEITRRALKGVTKPIYHGGKQVGSVQEYSDALAMFLMKAHKPSKYRDAPPQTVINNNADNTGKPIEIRFSVKEDAPKEAKSDGSQ